MVGVAMSWWIVLDPAGAPIAAVATEADEAPDAGVFGGASVVPGIGPVDGAVTRWDKDASAFVVDLDKLRAAKWEEIKAQREARRVVITTSWGPFDADETAKTNLLGRLTAISMGAAADVVWKLHDNSFVTIAAADFPAACMAVMAGVEAVYAASFALEAALASADTAEAIEAVDVMAGWPE